MVASVDHITTYISSFSTQCSSCPCFAEQSRDKNGGSTIFTVRLWRSTAIPLSRLSAVAQGEVPFRGVQWMMILEGKHRHASQLVVIATFINFSFSPPFLAFWQQCWRSTYAPQIRFFIIPILFFLTIPSTMRGSLATEVVANLLFFNKVK